MSVKFSEKALAKLAAAGLREEDLPEEQRKSLERQALDGLLKKKTIPCPHCGTNDVTYGEPWWAEDAKGWVVTVRCQRKRCGKYEKLIAGTLDIDEIEVVPEPKEEQ